MPTFLKMYTPNGPLQCTFVLASHAEVKQSNAWTNDGVFVYYRGHNGLCISTSVAATKDALPPGALKVVSKYMTVPIRDLRTRDRELDEAADSLRKRLLESVSGRRPVEPMGGATVTPAQMLVSGTSAPELRVTVLRTLFSRRADIHVREVVSGDNLLHLAVVSGATWAVPVLANGKP
jgi:hypothetical protein